MSPKITSVHHAYIGGNCVFFVPPCNRPRPGAIALLPHDQRALYAARRGADYEVCAFGQIRRWDVGHKAGLGNCGNGLTVEREHGNAGEFLIG